MVRLLSLLLVGWLRRFPRSCLQGRVMQTGGLEKCLWFRFHFEKVNVLREESDLPKASDSASFLYSQPGPKEPSCRIKGATSGRIVFGEGVSLGEQRVGKRGQQKPLLTGTLVISRRAYFTGALAGMLFSVTHYVYSHARARMHTYRRARVPSAKSPPHADMNRRSKCIEVLA